MNTHRGNVRGSVHTSYPTTDTDAFNHGQNRVRSDSETGFHSYSTANGMPGQEGNGESSGKIFHSIQGADHSHGFLYGSKPFQVNDMACTHSDSPANRRGCTASIPGGIHFVTQEKPNCSYSSYVLDDTFTPMVTEMQVVSKRESKKSVHKGKDWKSLHIPLQQSPYGHISSSSPEIPFQQKDLPPAIEVKNSKRPDFQQNCSDVPTVLAQVDRLRPIESNKSPRSHENRRLSSENNKSSAISTDSDCDITYIELPAKIPAVSGPRRDSEACYVPRGKLKDSPKHLKRKMNTSEDSEHSPQRLRLTKRSKKAGKVDPTERNLRQTRNQVSSSVENVEGTMPQVLKVKKNRPKAILQDIVEHQEDASTSVVDCSPQLAGQPSVLARPIPSRTQQPQKNPSIRDSISKRISQGNREQCPPADTDKKQRTKNKAAAIPKLSDCVEEGRQDSEDSDSSIRMVPRQSDVVVEHSSSNTSDEDSHNDIHSIGVEHSSTEAATPTPSVSTHKNTVKHEGTNSDNDSDIEVPDIPFPNRLPVVLSSGMDNEISDASNTSEARRKFSLQLKSAESNKKTAKDKLTRTVVHPLNASGANLVVNVKENPPKGSKVVTSRSKVLFQDALRHHDEGSASGVEPRLQATGQVSALELPSPRRTGQQQRKPDHVKTNNSDSKVVAQESIVQPLPRDVGKQQQFIKDKSHATKKLQGNIKERDRDSDTSDDSSSLYMSPKKSASVRGDSPSDSSSDDESPVALVNSRKHASTAIPASNKTSRNSNKQSKWKLFGLVC